MTGPRCRELAASARCLPSSGAAFVLVCARSVRRPQDNRKKHSNSNSNSSSTHSFIQRYTHPTATQSEVNTLRCTALLSPLTHSALPSLLTAAAVSRVSRHLTSPCCCCCCCPSAADTLTLTIVSFDRSASSTAQCAIDERKYAPPSLLSAARVSESADSPHSTVTVLPLCCPNRCRASMSASAPSIPPSGSAAASVAAPSRHPKKCVCQTCATARSKVTAKLQMEARSKRSVSAENEAYLRDYVSNGDHRERTVDTTDLELHRGIEATAAKPTCSTATAFMAASACAAMISYTAPAVLLSIVAVGLTWSVGENQAQREVQREVRQTAQQQHEQSRCTTAHFPPLAYVRVYSLLPRRWSRPSSEAATATATARAKLIVALLLLHPATSLRRALMRLPLTRPRRRSMKNRRARMKPRCEMAVNQMTLVRRTMSRTTISSFNFQWSRTPLSVTCTTASRQQ